MRKNLIFSKYSWLWILIFILLVRILTLSLATNDIPFTKYSEQGVLWWTEHGGDQGGYYQTTKNFFEAKIHEKAPPVGYSIFLLPFLLVFGSDDIAQIAKPVIIFQGVFLYTVAVFLVFWLANAVLKSRRKAGLISAVFLFYHYFFYFIADKILGNVEMLQNFAITRFKQLNFFVILSDPFSSVLVFIVLMIAIKLVQGNFQNKKLSLLLGSLTALSILTRMQNIVLAPLFAVFYLINKKYKSFYYYILSALPFAVVFFLFNYLSFGSVYKTTYGLSKGENLDIPMISFEYPLRIFTYPMKYYPPLTILIILIIVLLGVGIYSTIKNNRKAGVLVATFFCSSLIFISFLEPVFRNPRYFISLVPFFMIYLYSGFEFVYIKIINLWKKIKVNIV